MTKSVGARELKTRLGGYLREVEGGTTYVVTERGRPVAELRPLPAGDGGPEAAVLDQLAALGVLTRPVRRVAAHVRPVRAKGAALSKAIREDREGRG